MLENKDELIKEYGKHDGLDDTRYEIASELSQKLDEHVNFCFIKLINLENKGFIKLKKDKNVN